MGNIYTGQLNKREGIVNINHRLYGEQIVSGEMIFVNDEKKIGIKIGTREIFLWKDEVNQIEYGSDYFYIQGDIMELMVKFS